MRFALTLAARLAVTLASAQAPRIRWKQMDFPPETVMEIAFDGRQRNLGPFRIFYDFAKMQS